MASTSVAVSKGTYKLNGLVAEHWALKVGDTWYEIAGASKKHDGMENFIEQHGNDDKYSTIELQGYTEVDNATLLEFIEAWLQEHPEYSVTGDNCQLFVKDMIDRLLSLPVTTQNKNIGDMLITAGTCVVVAAAAVIGVGVVIKGSH